MALKTPVKSVNSSSKLTRDTSIRDLQDTFIRLQTFYITIQAFAFDFVCFQGPCLSLDLSPPTSNVLWPNLEFICAVSKIIPKFECVNLLDVKDQHHYLQHIQLHNDHPCPTGADMRTAGGI